MPLNLLAQRPCKSSFFHAFSYRIPLPVVVVVVFRSGDGYSVCPRCDNLLEREYMSYCNCCGQCLAWELFDHAKVVNWPRKK